MRYTRLPFGFKSAPGIFQSIMDNMLVGMIKVRPYMDDILVGGDSIDECIYNTNMVFGKLQEYNVKANFNKCKFIRTEIEYLGFRISEHGIKPMENKLHALQNAPAPKGLTELKSYLGLLNFYGKFIPCSAIECLNSKQC